MAEPTKGLRLEFKEGLLGLHFTCAGTGERPYPEGAGPIDMAYVNWLIETDERRREQAAKKAAAPGDLMVDMGNLGGTEKKFTQMLQKMDSVQNEAYESMVEDHIGGFNHCVIQGISPLVALYAMSQAFAIVLGFALRANLPFSIAQSILAQQMQSATASEKMVRIISQPTGHG